MDNRVKTIDHNGKKIIYCDFTGLNGDDFVHIIDRLEEMSLKMGNNEIFHLLNFTNTKVNDQAKKRANAMIENLTNKGFRVKSAFFGIDGIQRIITNAVAKEIHFAKDEKDAKNWLTKG